MKNLNIVLFIEIRKLNYNFYSFVKCYFIWIYFRIADNLIRENDKIFGLKKTIFYFLILLFIATTVALTNYKLFINNANIDGEENEEEAFQETIILNSEPIENALENENI